MEIRAIQWQLSHEYRVSGNACPYMFAFIIAGFRKPGIIQMNDIL